ncbi:MAG: SBBP repeat-containing protein, partial [Acidobacteria bacterium]|nr:SBBP repeat-containing protein [Acidobacteriota bacterium]
MKRAMFLAVLVCLGILLVTGQKAKEAAPQDSKGLVLSYSTYLGGSGVDDCDALAVDGSGNVYLACHSTSTDFPTVDSAHYANRGKFDAFVVKLNPSGSEVIYVTHFGGSKWEAGNGITVDAAGNAYVVGTTYSPDFPTTEGAFQTTFGGQQDVFVTKLDSSGSVVYTTYLGGSGEDLSYGIAIDDLGNVYVAGMTDSPDFPTANPFQPALGGGRDAFVAKLNPSGTALVYSTYLGGSGNEGRWGARIAVDASGNAYVAGGTESADFPTVNPLQAALAGKQDTFVAKLNPTGSALVYSTYLGGSGEEEAGDIAIDASGNVYVGGGTESPDFPAAKAWQNVLGGGQDAFVAKLNPTGSALIYSTYLGGKGKDF